MQSSQAGCKFSHGKNILYYFSNQDTNQSAAFVQPPRHSQDPSATAAAKRVRVFSINVNAVDHISTSDIIIELSLEYDNPVAILRSVKLIKG
jgi:hypothetical protein